MRKIYKYIPSCLYAILLIVIAILCIAITNALPINSITNDTQVGNIEEINPDTTENTSGETEIPTIPPSDDLPVDIPQDTITPDTPTTVPPIVYNGEIPRQAYTDDVYSYAQKIYGNGETTLKEVIQTSVGIFTIVCTNSTQGDVYGENQCVGIVKLDAYGNILSATSLNYNSTYSYVTACATPVGLVVITAPSDLSHYYVYVLTYDLGVSPAYRISASNGGKIIPTSNSFLFFAEYPDETLAYVFNDNGFTFQSVCSGKIAEVMEYGSYYTIFSSNAMDNSYSIIKLSKTDLKVISETKCSSATAIDVFPVFTDDTQSFIVLEDRNGVVWAKKYKDNTFSSVLDTKRIGTFSVSSAHYDGEDILMVCHGNLNGIIALSADLSTKFNENTTDFVPDNILDSAFINGTLYYLSTDSANNLALAYSKNDVTSIEYFGITTLLAKFIVNLDNSFMVFYQTSDGVNVIGIK